jgi:hypothetical protein
MRPGKTKLLVLILMASFLVFGVVCVGLDVGHADLHDAQPGHGCNFLALSNTNGINPLQSMTLSMVSSLAIALLSLSLALSSADYRRLTLHPTPQKILPLQRRLALLQTLVL